MNECALSPYIFDIARGSTVDGPGIRTVVFFKGCPLRCRWCQNPESQSAQVEMFYDPEKCIDCGNCRAIKENGSDNVDPDCCAGARKQVGKYYTPPKLARLIIRDEVFYRTSGGGVTFSGGEPLLYIDYLKATAVILKAANIHIAVETCGYFDYEKFEKALLPYIDLFLFDIKLVDPVAHENVTGKSNAVIIRNFERLLAAGVEVLPRVPLIPGFTATIENMTQVRDFFRSHGVKKFEFLSYNPSGLDKWKRLGKTAPAELSPKPLTLEEERSWVEFFKGA